MLIFLDKRNKVDIAIQAHGQDSLLRVSLRIWVLSNIEQIPCLNGNDDSFKAQEPPPHADQWLDQKPGSRRVLIKPTAWRAHRRADAWSR